MFRRFPIVVLSASLAAPAAGRQFEDQFGRTIEAELVSHWGAGNGLVKIDKAGKILTVKLETFSEKNQKELVEWMNSNPRLLAPLVNPSRSGDGVVSGSKWLLIGQRGTRQIEFGGAGTLKVNGAPDKTTRWDVGADKHIAIIPSFGQAQRFSQPVVSERIYRDPASDSLLVKIDRLAGGLKPADLENSSFVLTHHRSVSPLGEFDQTLAVVNFSAGGEAESGDQKLKWAIDKGGIGLRNARGSFVGFGAWSKDVFVSRSGHVLLKVTPPRTR